MTQAGERESTTAAATQVDTVRITLKLFALLSSYLPDGAKYNQVKLDAPVGSTPTSVMASLHLPAKLCALVILNGVFVRAADRATQRLVEGDVLAIWPPIAGG